jgi:hypothetical protein
MTFVKSSCEKVEHQKVRKAVLLAQGLLLTAAILVHLGESSKSMPKYRVYSVFIPKERKLSPCKQWD